MKHQILKKATIFIMLLLLIAPVAMHALPVSAQNLGLPYAQNLGLADTTQDPRDAAVNIVKYLMTFLGIIAVIVILYGGFVWLTAGGNEDKVAKAKKLIVAGIIGLIIILASFAIVQFIVNTTSNLLRTGAA